MQERCFRQRSKYSYERVNKINKINKINYLQDSPIQGLSYFFDEPTTALDVSIQSQILSLLKYLRDGLNMFVIIITHNFGVIWVICDRVNVMYAGNIIESASVKRIYDNPLHPYTNALLGSIMTIK